MKNDYKQLIKTFVEIKTDFEGVHQYKKCPYDEVSFLKYPHRHKIYIIVKISTNADREIEFFMLKMEIDKLISKLFGKQQIKRLGQLSMEKMGIKIISELVKKKYKDCKIQIKVMEDNQVGGVVEYEP